MLVWISVRFKIRSSQHMTEIGEQKQRIYTYIYDQYDLPPPVESTVERLPPEQAEIPQSKRRKLQKDVGLQNLQNENAKFKTEIKLQKEYQRDLIRDQLNIEMERNALKEEVQALYMKKTQVSSLVCILEIIMAGIENMDQDSPRDASFRQLRSARLIMFE